MTAFWALLLAPWASRRRQLEYLGIPFRVTIRQLDPVSFRMAVPPEPSPHNNGDARESRS